MLIAQVCDFGNDGDAHYRLHAPSMYLGRIPGVSTVDCHFCHRKLPLLIEQADVLVLQFVNDWDLLSICNYRRQLGKVTVFEANDYFFDLQPWSPIAGPWCDREIQELYRQLLKTADGVQTSTRFLAEKWREFGARNVAVFENHLTAIPKLSTPGNRPFTVGWAGSPGHFADLLHIVPALQRWIIQHPDAHLAVMTNDLAKTFFQLPPERFHFQNFGPLEEYIAFLGTLDVGLAPLLPTDYNRGRSDVKFLEYSSQGVPGIYQNLDPYQSIIRDGQNGFLCNSPDELIQKLNLLYQDQTLREQVRTNAYNYVDTHRMLDANIGERLDWYRSLLKESETPCQPELLNDLKPYQDNNSLSYFALKAGGPEKQLLSALTKPSPEEVHSSLQTLLEQEKEFAPALYQLAQRWNDLRKPGQVLQMESELQRLAPYSMKWKMEHCRAHFLNGDTAKAMNGLHLLVQNEPGHLPSWKYLLRLLAVTHNPDGEMSAKKAMETFPFCYPLAILALDNLPATDRLSSLEGILNQVKDTLALFERQPALKILRQAILEALKNQPASPSTASLLRSSVKVFPESLKLRQTLAVHLQQLGEGEESLREMAHVARGRLLQNLSQEEFPPEPLPYLLQFAHFMEVVLKDKQSGHA